MEFTFGLVWSYTCSRRPPPTGLLLLDLLTRAVGAAPSQWIGCVGGAERGEGSGKCGSRTQPRQLPQRLKQQPRIRMRPTGRMQLSMLQRVAAPGYPIPGTRVAASQSHRLIRGPM